ncbi:MAG: FMN-binding protein [candidate division WOR-3 bacterium]
MSENIKQKIYLFISLLLSVLTLTILNEATKPLVAQPEGGNNFSILKKAIDGNEFIPVIPETLWQVYDSAKNIKGFVFKIWTRGYAGVIPITAGFDTTKKITGVYISGADEGFKETKGLGSKVREKSFLNQFIGKNVSQIALKKDGGEIDAITGATISSRAVCEGIKKGLETYTSLLEESKKADRKKEIFPDANRFLEVIKDTLWYAISHPETLGIIFYGQTFGYLDTIKYLAGINKEKCIEKIIIVYSQETEGIGERIREQEFLDKFKTGMPDAISGATISSQALIKSVQDNFERFKEYLK